MTLSFCLGDVAIHAGLRAGRELATGRKIAIKKIKVGQFKDGLDMSAVREVKYLRELHHPNVIEVGTPYTASPEHSLSTSYRIIVAASGRVLLKDQSEPCARVPRHRPRDDHQGPHTGLSARRYQKLDGDGLPRS